MWDNATTQATRDYERERKGGSVEQRAPINKFGFEIIKKVRDRHFAYAVIVFSSWRTFVERKLRNGVACRPGEALGT